MSWLVSPEALITVRLFYVALAIAGLAVSGYTSRDCYLDLRARRAAGQNGDLEAIGRIGLRSSLAVAAPLHFGFLLLGLVALGSPAALPGYAVVFGRPISRVLLTELFSMLYILIQGSVLMAQLRNQYDRIQVRRKYH